MKALLRRAATLRPVEGLGLYGTTGRSWGGCGATLRYNEGRDGHDCATHAADQPSWQHRCGCGFRWAAK